MKVTCKNEDIDSIIKLDKKRDDGPILVKFTTIRKKLEILANRKNLSNTNIYVDEDYSKEVVEKRKELKKVLKQLKNEGKKNVHLKRDELWVDGVLWTGDQTTQTIDSDIEMEDGLAQQELKNTGNKKRGRSPSEATGQKNRKPKKAVPIRSQTTISKFFNSSLEPRQRSSSAGPNLGPEVAKIVDKLTPKDSKENQSQPKGKETQHAATIPNKEEKKAEGETEGLRGTGFLINKKWKDNIKMLKSNTDRIVQVLISVGVICMRIIQVYAPTTDSQDDELELFYCKLQETLDEKYENSRTYLIGDWNCKVGFRKYGEREMGDYGYGTRNNRGERFLEFVSENEMYVINSFYANGDKWTWVSPNGKVKNEIDFTITKDKKSVIHFEVVNRPNIGSDHRPILTKIGLQKKELRRQKFAKVRKIEGETLKVNQEKYSKELEKKLSVCSNIGNGLEEDYKELKKVLLKTAGEFKCTKKSWHRKLSDRTLNLLEKRRKMKRTGPRDKIEYAELSKLIRKLAEQDIQTYNNCFLQKVVEKNESLRKAKGELSIGKTKIISLKDKYGEILTDKEDIVHRIAEFYQDLYSDQDQITVKSSSHKIENFNETEVTKVLSKMKNGKSGGRD
ncbi:uncharacterized protein LOC108253947, partial [Diaphorina citri]|uniref:Uncharacterized protein LOC108253947 n=1 Tax=Diaphorina citri TaxID=121845 RepID=A0A1S4EQE8_DIACI